jgi:hypothetical protein
MIRRWLDWQKIRATGRSSPKKRQRTLHLTLILQNGSEIQFLREEYMPARIPAFSPGDKGNGSPDSELFDDSSQRTSGLQKQMRQTPVYRYARIPDWRAGVNERLPAKAAEDCRSTGSGAQFGEGWCDWTPYWTPSLIGDCSDQAVIFREETDPADLTAWGCRTTFFSLFGELTNYICVSL